MAGSRAASPEQAYGSLVAVEGDCQTVSTQLRLLPPSSKILILPPLIDDVRKRSEETQFNARTFVRDVHAAFTTRAETARSFLKSSTSDQPRLVFLNGGSVCAKTTCITNICENVTDGKIQEAEALFGEIVKDGVAGLLKSDPPAEELTAEQNAENTDDNDEKDQERSSSDAGSVAMKAADDLDRSTADLQPSKHEEVKDDMMVTADAPKSFAKAVGHDEVKGAQEEDISTPRAIQDPQDPIASRKASTDETSDAEFTSPSGEVIRQTVLTIPRYSQDLTHETALPTASSIYSDVPPHHHEKNHIEDGESANQESLSTEADVQQSQPSTPNAGVEFGEACIVDVQSANTSKKMRRVKSMDKPFNTSSKTTTPNTVDIRQSKSYHDLRKMSLSDAEAFARSESFDALPRAPFVRASTTNIKRSPTLKSASLVALTYEDRGCDPITEEAKEAEAPFQPVFPVIEDLVIYFSNTNNEIFEAVIRAYKDGSYPVFPAKKEPEIEQEAVTVSPTEGEEHPADESRPFSQSTAETDDDAFQHRQEIDPYNPDSYPGGQRVWPRQQKNFSQIQSIAEPPTPATTPPPVLTQSGQKFHEFSPINSNSAVGVQNSLRSVLKIHFGPAETTKYRQYEAPLDCDRLWKPVFRDDDGQGNEGRTVDQIIALGCEDGVSKDFFSDISSQIEKLGTKKSGLTRTGKLDVRYLIATAMQSHTSQPLTAQSASNPFGNPMTLANALVPHLETYLAVNTSIRLLILTYPAQHLPTIISLRKILGSDLFKVGGIIDALGTSDPPSFARSKTPPPALNLLSNEGAASLNQRHKPAISIGSFARTRAELARQASAAHSYSISNTSSKHNSAQLDPSFSFAKANFLLPSTATDAEITTFLTSIWKTLIEKSNWYTPESPTATPTAAVVPAPLTPATPAATVEPTSAATSTTNLIAPPIPNSQFGEAPPLSPMVPSHRPKKSMGGRSKIDQLLGNNAPSPTTGSGRAHPPVSMKNADSNNGNGTSGERTNSFSGRTGTSHSEKQRRDDKAWENFYLGPEGESDDEYERRLMPNVPIRTDRKKGNSRKALKWLGLA